EVQKVSAEEPNAIPTGSGQRPSVAAQKTTAMERLQRLRLQRRSPTPVTHAGAGVQEPATLPREHKVETHEIPRRKGIITWIIEFLGLQRSTYQTSFGGGFQTVQVAPIGQEAAQVSSIAVALQAPQVVAGAEQFDLQIRLSFQPSAAFSLKRAKSEIP